jgi:hypothetical protein
MRPAVVVVVRVTSSRVGRGHAIRVLVLRFQLCWVRTEKESNSDQPPRCGVNGPARSCPSKPSARDGEKSVVS